MQYVASRGESHRKYAWKVLEGLVSCILAPPIAASNPDPDAPPCVKWSPTGCHFKVDVANAVRAALPRPELRRTFWRLVYRLAMGLSSPDQPTDNLTSTALMRTGKIFAERRLAPRTYFGERRPA